MAIPIPRAEEQVRIRTPEVSTPQLTARIPPAAFGGGVAEADQQMGEAVARLGSALSQRLAERQQREEEEQVLAADTDARMQLQSVLADPEAGLLNRSLSQAKGATKSLDQQYVGLRKKVLDQVPHDRQKKALASRLDSHYADVRGQVIRHEAQQERESFKTILDANLRQRVADAGVAIDPEAVGKAIDEAQFLQRNAMRHMGSPEEEMSMNGQLLAADIAKASIGALLEKDPHRAQALLDGAKDRLPATSAAALQEAIDGKMLDVRRSQAWDSVKGLRHPDGTADIGAMLKAAEGQSATAPEGQRQPIMDFVRQQAAVQDAFLKDSREAQDRSFFNAALKLKQGNVPYEQAHDYLFKRRGFGFDAVDRDAKQRSLLDLYTKDQTFYDEMAKRQTPEQERVMEEMRAAASATWGRFSTIKDPATGLRIKTSDAFAFEMERQMLGKSPAEMTRIYREALKEVPTVPGWFGMETESAWKIQRDIRLTRELQSAALEPLRSQAVDFLIKSGRAATPENIETVIRRLGEKADRRPPASAAPEPSRSPETGPEPRATHGSIQ